MRSRCKMAISKSKLLPWSFPWDFFLIGSHCSTISSFRLFSFYVLLYATEKLKSDYSEFKLVTLHISGIAINANSVFIVCTTVIHELTFIKHFESLKSVLHITDSKYPQFNTKFISTYSVYMYVLFLVVVMCFKFEIPVPLFHCFI